MRAREATKRIGWAVCIFLLGQSLLPTVSHAATAQAIDRGADTTLDQFRSRVKGADDFLRGAKGYLVFPEVIQGGIGVGGQYGEGVLRIGGKSAAYYSIKSGSIGFQLGAQRKSIIIAFLQDQALVEFEAKAEAGNAWNVGADGSVVLLNLGAQASINSATINQPIVGFVFGQQGLMYNLSLQGSNISRLRR
jgi:lipid-binding SYLF domain-containing protein